MKIESIGSLGGGIRAAIGAGLIWLIRRYQSVSRFTPSVCRFYPTCSEYALQAVQKYGAGRGVWMAICRIGRCHPFHPGGYDPVK